MAGWLMWGLILPLLLVVAGIVTIRRRNHRPAAGPQPGGHVGNKASRRRRRATGR